jgi:hypothetical protein
MKSKRQNSRHERKRIGSTARAVLISGVLGLLVMLLGNEVTDLIHVPTGWEWVPVAALVVTFVIALYVQMRGTGETNARRGVSLKDVRVERESEISGVKANGGDVSLDNVQVKDGSKIHDIEAR